MYSNVKGAYLEKTINYSIKSSNNFLMFKISPELCKNIYTKHGYVDYICFFDNKALGIEAKECSNEKYFYLSKISDNQKKILDLFSKYGTGTIIFYFDFFKKFILINWLVLKKNTNANSVRITDIIKNGINIDFKNNKLNLNKAFSILFKIDNSI